MMLSTHFGNLEPAPSVKEELHCLFSAAVERFRSKIRAVNVSVRDINGPKGGVDKQCRCIIHLNRMAPIVIEDKDENYGNLLHRVAERVAYTLSTRIDRLQKSSRSRKTRDSLNQLDEYIIE